MVFLQPADFIPDALGSCAICPSRELHQLPLTSPPKPAKASLKQSLEIFKNLDLELSSLCDVDYTICCCHPLISLCLSGFRFQHSHHLGSFPHLIPNTVASSRDYSVGASVPSLHSPLSPITDPCGATGFSGGCMGLWCTILGWGRCVGEGLRAVTGYTGYLLRHPQLAPQWGCRHHLKDPPEK